MAQSSRKSDPFFAISPSSQIHPIYTMNSCLTKTLFLQSPSSETNKKIEKCYKAKIVGYFNIFLWGKKVYPIGSGFMPFKSL